ncbi:type I-D CRISPR-associated helicase Cas3' [Candidatus Poribacteria bacterium]|nr:type I-D CRISPR-associated helicase Cas3' [Candidatus Poribacteria bacterium]
MPERTVTLKAGYEKVNPTNEFQLKHPPLYHQKRTYDELRENDLVINTYNTGTGKTQASLLRLFDLKEDNDNVLFIAPTNELICQHADDIRDFVKKHELNFEVAEITGEKLREWESVYDPGYNVRNPRKLHEIIEYPNSTEQKKLILVTNPDIFYLCFYSRYSKMDSANLFRDFLVKFNYIVIDEFHYYNAKQLANFLMFFIFSKKYGYFKKAGRKICLLSATPDDKLFKYLDEIDLKYKLVSPDNEPAESDSYEKVQTLSEIELTIHSNKIHDSLKAHPELILDLLNSEKEGAIISSSLRTITDINQGLKNAGLEGKIGLITGAVDPAERDKATSYPLVLATPTVDIGYNFKKEEKLRQNIDFVCFDALYGSEFTQRIGRAGRLLGKKNTTHSSIGHAFVQGKLYSQLEEGKNYDRQEFAALVKDSLGEDNRFYHYIQSYAVLEAFYPLYGHLRRVPENRQDRVREVFETIRKVFAPESDTTFDEIMKKIQWHIRYENVIDAHEKNVYDNFIQRDQEKATWSYLKYQSWLNGKLEEFQNTPSKQLNTAIKGFIKRRSNREEVVEHAKQKHCPIQSLFNFRGSDVGIRCAIYDPYHFFQNTANYTEYDLFHVLLHYEFTVIPTKEKYHELTGNWRNYCEFFVRVDARKEVSAKIQFDYNADDVDKEYFERQHCWGPTALKGIRFSLSNRNLPFEMQDILEDRYITCLLSKMENRYDLSNILETKRQIAYPLFVSFNDGQEEYKLILGSQAFLIHAELQGKWKAKERTVAT